MGTHKSLKLSPSRMKDYMQCPKLYYYKYELGLKTPATLATLRGTLAHYVFEYLFDFRPDSRTVETAVSMVYPCISMLKNPFLPVDEISVDTIEYLFRYRENYFEHMYAPGTDAYEAKHKETAEICYLLAQTDEKEFVASVEKAVQGWFAIEKPWKFEPTYRELHVGVAVGGTYVHGFVDRLDYVVDSKTGKTVVYVSDYKTGKKPSERYQGDAFFQLAVYSVILKHMKMCQVNQIRLMYVNAEKGEISMNVDAALIAQTETKIKTIGSAIRNSKRSGEWNTRKQVLCGWCHFKDVCPAFHKELDGLLPEDIEERLGRADYLGNSGRAQDS